MANCPDQHTRISTCASAVAYLARAGTRRRALSECAARQAHCGANISHSCWPGPGTSSILLLGGSLYIPPSHPPSAMVCTHQNRCRSDPSPPSRICKRWVRCRSSHRPLRACCMLRFPISSSALRARATRERYAANRLFSGWATGGRMRLLFIRPHTRSLGLRVQPGMRKRHLHAIPLHAILWDHNAEVREVPARPPHDQQL